MDERRNNGAASFEDTPAPDVVTASQAQEILGIGHNKVAQLLKEWETTQTGGLPFHRSDVDRRIHLIRRRDLETLRAQSQGITVEQARKALRMSRQKMQFLIKSGALPVRVNPLKKNQRFVDQERYEALLIERKVLMKQRREPRP